MNIIILEGPDGSGKTTLANALMGMGYKYAHFSVPPLEAQKSEESIFQFFLKPLIELSETAPFMLPPRVVIDRLHLSDQIYGPVMRERSMMTERAERLIERFTEAIDGQIVICLPPHRIALANWMDRRQDEYVQEISKFTAIYRRYADLLFSRTRNSNFVWYDYTRHRVNSFATSLATLSGNRLHAGMVGSQRARFVFVGEKAAGAPDLPFMTTLNSSGWLYDCISDAGYDERDICFGNALRLDGTPNDMQLICGAAPYRSQVIALGNTAHIALAANEIDHVTIEHPQYWKRFHSKNTKDYISRLAQIRRQAR